jgi:hypothetical protein
MGLRVEPMGVARQALTQSIQAFEETGVMTSLFATVKRMEHYRYTVETGCMTSQGRGQKDLF